MSNAPGRANRIGIREVLKPLSRLCNEDIWMWKLERWTVRKRRGKSV